MKVRKENVLLNLLLGAGVYLLESLRGRLPHTDELSDRARDRYGDLRNRLRTHTAPSLIGLPARPM
jgi:hypothetical protein